MAVTAPLLVLAATLAAPAGAKAKDPWVGNVVCCKSGSPETYRRAADGTFELHRVPLRYLDFRVVEEQGDFYSVQADDAEFWLKK